MLGARESGLRADYTLHEVMRWFYKLLFTALTLRIVIHSTVRDKLKILLYKGSSKKGSKIIDEVFSTEISNCSLLGLETK